MKFPGVTSLRNDFPICATPKGNRFRDVSRILAKLTSRQQDAVRTFLNTNSIIKNETDSSVPEIFFEHTESMPVLKPRFKGQRKTPEQKVHEDAIRWRERRADRVMDMSFADSKYRSALKVIAMLPEQEREALIWVDWFRNFYTRDYSNFSGLCNELFDKIKEDVTLLGF